jgi:hypothetical protein
MSSVTKYDVPRRKAALGGRRGYHSGSISSLGPIDRVNVQLKELLTQQEYERRLRERENKHLINVFMHQSSPSRSRMGRSSRKKEKRSLLQRFC